MMMTKLALLLGLLLLLCVPANAQSGNVSASSYKQGATTQSITSTAAGTAIDVTGYSYATITYSGTYTTNATAAGFQLGWNGATPSVTAAFFVYSTGVKATDTGDLIDNSTNVWIVPLVGANRIRTNPSNWTTGTINVVIVPHASPMPFQPDKLPVTPDSIALPANQSVNVAQTNGVTPLMGNGVTGTGSPRVTVASDNTAFGVNSIQSGTWTVQPGNTANTTAWKVDSSAVNQPVIGAAASGAAKSGNPVQIGHVFNSTQPTVTNGQAVESQGTARGAHIVATGVDTFNVTVNAALPTGTNVIGHVINDSGSTTAVTGTVIVDSELPAAAAAADGASNPTAPFMLAAGTLFNGTTWDRIKSAANALNSTGTGIGTAQIVGQFDDTSPTAITENQFGNLRMSANRNLFGTIRDAAGNERGANVTATNELLVAGGKTNNNAAPGATNVGALIGIANAAAPSLSEGNLVLGSLDLAGNHRTVQPDQVATGSLTSTTSVTLTSNGAINSIAVQLTGTWTATVQFEGNVDGSNFFSVNALPFAGGAFVTSATGNGNWQINASGLNQFRVRCSAFTSGTIVVTIRSSRGQSLLNLNNAYSTSNGVTDSGTQRVTLSNDSTGVVGGTTAHNASPTGNPFVAAGYSMTDGTAPTATTAGNVTRILSTTDGRLLVSSDHPKRFSASIVNNSGTTLTQLQAAPGAGLSLYITDVIASSSVAATTTADQYLELKSGTGTNCATGTAVIWASYNTANGAVSQQFLTPIKVAANSAVCWMHAATGSKTFIVNGYIAP